MSWWNYLLLVNIYLLLFYGFYALLLRKETFFQLNRIYLVAAALLSFFIPMIQSDWVKNLFITKEVQYTIYSSPVITYRFRPTTENHVTLGQLLAVVYIIVIVFLTGRFIWQLISLKRVIAQPQSDVSYSFFKKIKLADEQEDNDVINAHEIAHAKQWHSADVLMIEAVMIINWFNPVVYLYRFAIKHIHEFIADQQALKSGTNRADYALLLLRQTFDAPAHQLVNPFFNHSLLKQRIVMLQKNKSHRIALFKYCLSAPLFMLMLILSSATVNNSKTIKYINIKTKSLLQTPAIVSDTKIATVQPEKIVIEKRTETIPGNSDTTKKIIIDTIKRVTPATLHDTTPGRNLVFTAVEQTPSFPGGMKAFGEFLSKNIRYPSEAREKGIQGRVFIQFVVERDGSLTGFRIVRGIGGGADEEAVRVLALSPNWEPGFQNGKPVRVQYSVPISFTLSDGGPVKPAENKTGVIINNNNGWAHDPIALSFSRKLDTSRMGGAFHLDGFKNSPLFILDGKEVDKLTDINPNTIDNITVLKDQSAYALYGTKGVNGVIIITTKRKAIK